MNFKRLHSILLRHGLLTGFLLGVTLSLIYVFWRPSTQVKKWVDPSFQWNEFVQYSMRKIDPANYACGELLQYEKASTVGHWLNWTIKSAIEDPGASIISKCSRDGKSNIHDSVPYCVLGVEWTCSYLSRLLDSDHCGGGRVYLYAELNSDGRILPESFHCFENVTD